MEVCGEVRIGDMKRDTNGENSTSGGIEGVGLWVRNEGLNCV